MVWRARKSGDSPGCRCLHNLSRKSEIFVTYAKLNALAETTQTQMATTIIVTMK